MSDLYSRNYSGRGGGRWNGGGQGTPSDRADTRPTRPTDAKAMPVPPPAYSGTLYISAKNTDAENNKNSKSEPTVAARRREINTSADREGNVRTVRYNGEPYFPDQTGLYDRDQSSYQNGGSYRDDNYGKGGHPDLGGGDSLRFRRGPRGPIVGDRSDIDYYDSPRTTSANPLGALLPFDIPSPEDIILIALIITLISARASGDFSDDILIIILGVLLLTGRQKD